jgi:hypothetical protein
VAVAGAVFTLDGRGYYGDDFALRAMDLEHGWLGAYGHYAREWGLFRPLGVLDILAWHHGLWRWPVAQQALMVTLHAVMCLLFYRFVLKLTGDPAVAVVSGAVFAAWHACTDVVAWPSHGAEMLPAGIFFLGSLLLYLRHLRTVAPAGTQPFLLTAVLLFAVSVLFHDQHLGAAAMFSALAVLSRSPGGRVRRVVWTWPFWAVSALIGGVSVMTTAGTVRPLEPGLDNVIGGLIGVAETFWHTTLWQSAGQWVHRSGAVAMLQRQWTEDPQRLGLATLGVLVGCVLIACFRTRPHPTGTWRGMAKLTALGLVLAAVSMMLMAAAANPALLPRHTMWPGMGLAMVIGGVVGFLRARSLHHLATAAAVLLVFGLSMTRLGHVYEWNVRTGVMNGVLRSLARVEPAPADEQLIVIEGVRQYGRGFTAAWGLTNAYRVASGTSARITTLVRRENDGYVANAEGDIAWPVDPATTRFFLWDEHTERLIPSNLDAYLSRQSKSEPRAQASGFRIPALALGARIRFYCRLKCSM